MAVKIIVHNLVKKDNEVLLLKRASNVTNLPNYWDIPGGSLENGEDLASGAVRETVEETGLSTTEPKIFYYFANYETSKDMHYITIFFISDFVSGSVVLNPEEHQEYRWVYVSDMVGFSKENNTPDYFPSLSVEVSRLK